MKTLYKNESGELHRLDGPAIDWYDGDKSWWINGKRHREDGPAVEYNDGRRYWYLNDILYSEDQYRHELAKIKLKRLVEL